MVSVNLHVSSRFESASRVIPRRREFSALVREMKGVAAKAV
jgi:hypothetical protein